MDHPDDAEGHTAVVNPFCAGAPWYKLRLSQRDVSPLPRIRTTRFVNMFTTLKRCSS